MKRFFIRLTLSSLLGTAFRLPLLADETRPPADGNFEPLAVALHVHSMVSREDKPSLQALASLAARRGIDVLVPTDHFLTRWTYGLRPFPGIIRRTFSRPCVYRFGPRAYLNIIDRINNEQKNTLVMPGLEVSPAAYWTGHPAKGNLTLRDSGRHLFVLGIGSEKVLADLPQHANPAIGTFDWTRLVLPAALILFGLVLMIRWPAGLLVVVLGILWALNQRTFRKPPPAFSEYTRNGFDAAQTVIDYVNAHGGISIWAHPESPPANQRLSRSVAKETDPYPEAVSETTGHAGFGYFPAGMDRIGGMGNRWDRELLRFVDGRRAKPFWAFAEIEDASSGDFGLGGAKNIVWSDRKTPEEILEAFRSGRFYASRRFDGKTVALERWEAASPEKTGFSGDGIEWDPNGRLRIAVTADEGTKQSGMVSNGGGNFSLSIVRNGRAWKVFEFGDKLHLNLPIPAVEREKADYYRLVAAAGAEVVTVSNPIFVSSSPRKAGEPLPE